MSDASNGYESRARDFMAGRNPTIGVATVRAWARALPARGTILDLGCGHGLPISRALMEDGFEIYGVDASATLVAAFGERCPQAHLACAAVADSDFFGRTFDGVIAWGLLFLLSPDEQRALIPRIGSALNAGGRLLFTAPAQPCTWNDRLTGRQSISLGTTAYRAALSDAGLGLVAEYQDEGDNHYYEALK